MRSLIAVCAGALVVGASAVWFSGERSFDQFSFRSAVQSASAAQQSPPPASGQAGTPAQPAQPPEPLVVKPIDPGPAVLPDESETAGITKFSFIAYGDTRGQADGSELQYEHGRIVDAMLEAIRARRDGE